MLSGQGEEVENARDVAVTERGSRAGHSMNCRSLTDPPGIWLRLWSHNGRTRDNNLLKPSLKDSVGKT